MKTVNPIALAITVGLSILPLRAQAATDPKAAAAPAMPRPKPGPEMEKLKPMIGTWQVEELHEPGFMGPGGKGHGIGHVTLGPGGLSLQINYQSGSGHMKGFKGHGILAWDAEAKCYKQAWSDNMMPMIMTSTGNWDGADFVMNTEGTMMGKPFKSQDRFTGIGPGGFTLTTEMSMDGGPMKKVMTLVHRRSKAEARK